VFSFGTYLTTRFVKLPEPHIAVATIQGRANFLDLELHAWNSEQGGFTNTYTIQDAPHATVDVSERHIRYTIYGQAYEVHQNKGQYRENRVIPIQDTFRYILQVWQKGFGRRVSGRKCPP